MALVGAVRDRLTWKELIGVDRRPGAQLRVEVDDEECIKVTPMHRSAAKMKSRESLERLARIVQYRIRKGNPVWDAREWRQMLGIEPEGAEPVSWYTRLFLLLRAKIDTESLDGAVFEPTDRDKFLLLPDGMALSVEYIVPCSKKNPLIAIPEVLTLFAVREVNRDIDSEESATSAKRRPTAERMAGLLQEWMQNNGAAKIKERALTGPHYSRFTSAMKKYDIPIHHLNDVSSKG